MGERTVLFVLSVYSRQRIIHIGYKISNL